MRPQQDIGGTGPWPDSPSAWTIPCNLWAIERVLLVFNRCVENREACFQKERGRCGERDSSECAYARSNSVDSKLHCGRADFKTCYDFMCGLFQFKLFRESFFCWTSRIACIFFFKKKRELKCRARALHRSFPTTNKSGPRKTNAWKWNVSCVAWKVFHISFTGFVFWLFVCLFLLLHDPDSNTGGVTLNSWMIENLPEGNEQNQEDHSNNCVSAEMLTGYLRNKGQSEQRCSVGVASNLFRVHIPCFVIYMF